MTPTIRIAQNVFAKMENFNPGGSHKSRSARLMIKDAIDRGFLIPNGDITILEKTGGNLGIGLAIEAAKYNINADLAVGNSFSPHKKMIMKYLGANIVGTELLNQGASPAQVIEACLAGKLHPEKKYFFIDQFNNPANVLAHFTETGPEILDFLRKNSLTDHNVLLVGGIGSGASLTGIGKYLRQSIRNLNVIGVVPKGCDFVEGKFVTHNIQGIAVGVTPPLYDPNIVDSYCYVDECEVMKTKQQFSRSSGYLIGNSSAANILAARTISSQYPSHYVIVTLIYDSGDSYLT